MRRHARLPLATAAAAWVLAAGHVGGSEELLLVSGACDDLGFLNGLMFQEQGHTASGAPYYKALGASQYMYWDPNCYNGAEPTARWILDADKPSLTASVDLDQDGDCQYNARVDSGDMTHPPMHAMWHLMCGGVWRDQVLMFAHLTTTITATTTSSISSTTSSTSSSSSTTTATTTTTTSATTTGTTTTSISSTTLTTSSTTSSFTSTTRTTVTATSTSTATMTGTATTTTSTGTSTETTATATQTTATKTTSATSITTSASGSSSTTPNATAEETTTGSSSSSSSSNSSSSTMRAGSPTEVPAAQANGTTTQVPAARANGTSTQAPAAPTQAGGTTTQVSSLSTPARNTTGRCCRCCYVGSRATCCAGRDQQDLRPGPSTTMTSPRSTTTTSTGRDDDDDVADSNISTHNNTHHGSTTTISTGRDEDDGHEDVAADINRDNHNNTHHANTTQTTTSARRMSAINATGVTQATSVTTTATSATTANATQTAAVTTTNAAVTAPGAAAANATQTAAVTTTNAAVTAPVAATQPNATPTQTTATTTLSAALASPSWYWLEEEEEVVCCEDGLGEGPLNATPAPAVPDGTNATEEASTTAEQGLPETSTTTEPGQPEAVQLTGVACSSKDFLNGLVFSLRGRTASGAPLYASPQGLYLYHDPDCKGGGAGTARWILDTDAPDLSRLADLDGDEDCRYLARADSADAERPPANASWRIFCDGAWRSDELRLQEAAAPAEATLPVSTSARVELSGEPSEVLALSGACDLQDQLNGPLLLQGSTQSGAPYYKTLEGRFYVYFDPDCNGGPTGAPRWIIDSDAPNTTAAQDLDGDEDCKYLARTNSRSLQPPLEASWLMYCLEGWKEVALRLEVFEGNLSATTTEQQVIAVSSAPLGPCGASRLLAAVVAGLAAALGPGRGTY